MAINENRPTITYENIAVFQSDSPAHNTTSNSATGISFVPLADSVEISFSVDEKLVREIGNKEFNQKQSYLAPNVNFSLSKKESFTGLFDQLTGTDTDTNFYVAIKDKKLENVISGNNFDLDENTDFISVGNCFLNTVEVSQNVKGLMRSRYSYVGSNLTAQTGSDTNVPVYSNDFEGMALGNMNIDGGAIDDGLGLTVAEIFGGNESITSTTIGSFGGGSRDLQIQDGAGSTTYGIQFSGFSQTGSYEITGHYKTAGDTKLIVRARNLEVDPSETLFTKQFLPTDATFAGQGGFQYYRFLATDTDNSATVLAQAIQNIDLFDDDGTEISPTFGNGSLPDEGGTNPNGPYTSQGITITAGYSHFSVQSDGSATYGPHEAFGGSQMWWTLDLNNASLNHLTVDFGSKKTLSKIVARFNRAQHKARKIRILASNSSNFSSSVVFGEIHFQSQNHIDTLSSDPTITVNAGDRVTLVIQTVPITRIFFSRTNPFTYGSYSPFSFTGNLSDTKNVIEILLDGSITETSTINFEDITIQRKVLQLDAPSLNLAGDQTTGIKAELLPKSNDQSEFIVPFHNTNVSMQASGQNDNSVFTILSDSIQSFSLNCAIERRSVYSIGKKHVINRKKIHPNLGSFTVSNIASSFRIDGDSRTRLNDFIGEKFTIKVKANDLQDNFHGVKFEGQLVSHDLISEIGAAMSANFNFTFDLETLKNMTFLDRFDGASFAYSLRSINSGYLSHGIDYVVKVRRTDNVEANFRADQITDGTLMNFVGTSSTDNGFVSIWYDQSGNGLHAVNQDSRQPKIVDGGVLVTSGGKPAIKSPGGSHTHLEFLNTEPPYTTNTSLVTEEMKLSADGQFSLFMVVENDVTAQSRNYPPLLKLFSTSPGGQGRQGRNRRPFIFITSNNFHNGKINFSIDSFSGYQDNSKDRHLFSLIVNNDSGGTSTIHKDGTQVDSRFVTLDQNENASKNRGNGHILETDSHSTGDLFMSEMIYYISDQTSNRDIINSKIKEYYGIT